jgi:hypothetical protein
MEIETPSWLRAWGFELAKEAPTREVEVSCGPVDCSRNLEQVKQILQEEGVTPEMLLKHPYIRLTTEARKYLEAL